MQKQKQILTKRYKPARQRPIQTRRAITRAQFSSNVTPAYAASAIPAKSFTLIRFSWPVFRALCLVLIVGLVFGHIAMSQHAAAEIATQRQQAEAATLARESTFSEQIKPLIAENNRVSTAVSIALPGQPVQNFGSNNSYDGASTAKLLTAADYLHKVDTHRATLDETIDGLSARDQIERMIVDSDDTAWEQMNVYLGHDELTQYANSIGFDNYDAATNVFPASSVAKLLQSLYGGKLLAPSSRTLLLDNMKRANHREFMVAGVTSGVTVYHKIGIDEDNVHDAMILEKDGRWTVVVTFTDGHGTYDWNDRALFMQQIAAVAAQTLL